MRSVGSAMHARGLGIQDHLSWPYEHRADFLQRVREFISDGFALGLRCVYAGDGPLELLRADLEGIPQLHAEIARGALDLTPLGELYPAGAVLDPFETLSTFSAATENALANGYAGLRVVGDATPLLSSPDQLAAFTVWEHQADRYMTDHPFSGMCGFDRTRLCEPATIALASLHPVARAGSAPFMVYSSDRADLALAGELDSLAAEDFRACLERIVLDVTAELVVDGTRLRFVDHRALETIRDLARRHGTSAVFHTCSDMPGRLIDLLRLQGIRAERVLPEEVHA